MAFVEEDILGGHASFETPLGNLVADALRFVAKAEVSFIPNTFLGGSLPRGHLTEEKISRSILYPDDHVTVLLLQGSEICRMLEQSLSLFPNFNARFLQVSGVTVEFSQDIGMSFCGGNGRIRAVTVGGLPINLEKSYKAAMPLPLVQGFMGYVVRGSDNINTGIGIAQSISLYAKATHILRYRVEGRIKKLSR